MSDDKFSPEAFIDAPVVRQQVEERMKIEQPPCADLARDVAPPLPDPAREQLRVVLNDPALAGAVWQEPGPEAAPPDDAQAAVQLGMALYLLHALHSGDKPGQEHLPRPGERRRDEDDDGSTEQ